MITKYNLGQEVEITIHKDKYGERVGYIEEIEISYRFGTAYRVKGHPSLYTEDQIKSTDSKYEELKEV